MRHRACADAGNIAAMGLGREAVAGLGQREDPRLYDEALHQYNLCLFDRSDFSKDLAGAPAEREVRGLPARGVQPGLEEVLVPLCRGAEVHRAAVVPHRDLVVKLDKLQLAEAAVHVEELRRKFLQPLAKRGWRPGVRCGLGTVIRLQRWLHAMLADAVTRGDRRHTGCPSVTDLVRPLGGPLHARVARDHHRCASSPRTAQLFGQWWARLLLFLAHALYQHTFIEPEVREEWRVCFAVKRRHTEGGSGRPCLCNEMLHDQCLC
mmetsp:Transcript_81492/g.253236  ORF Transcript_81492/g.253236 Transcript_81492/m.253236 type:complete len:264 (+) Transcript_81492:434-1225(+)